jgi:hypothetical protein
MTGGGCAATPGSEPGYVGRHTAIELCSKPGLRGGMRVSA